LVFTIAAWVIAFGSYRLWVALKRDGKAGGTPHWRQRSVFGRTKRAHAIYGVLYLLLGAMLLATGFGVQMPFSQGCRSMLTGGKEQPHGEGRTLDLERAQPPVDRVEPPHGDGASPAPSH